MRQAQTTRCVTGWSYHLRPRKVGAGSLRLRMLCELEFRPCTNAGGICPCAKSLCTNVKVSKWPLGGNMNSDTDQSACLAPGLGTQTMKSPLSLHAKHLSLARAYERTHGEFSHGSRMTIAKAHRIGEVEDFTYITNR